jgi:hypothetical protein
MRDEDESLDGFDTAPPPAGAEDPYGAPTRVARVPENLLAELMKSRTEALDAPLRGKSTVTEPARAMPPRPAPAQPPRAAAPAPARNDAASNDLSALAAAASHAVAPPRPGAPPAGPSTFDPMIPANASEPDAHVPFGLDDPGFGESPSSPGARPTGTPQQSGHTVPLSAALLASVLKAVDDKRAAAPAPADAAVPTASDVAVPNRRSLFTLVLILAIGVGVFVTGVVMFLDVLQ